MSKLSVTEISVKRPAAITMLVVLLFGLGILGYTRLGADLMPVVNSPAVSIHSSYAGASSDDIKRDIVKPIEDGISGISGIESIDSSARSGSGSVTIRFTMETDMQTALADVSKAVERISGRLPADASRPTVFKFDSTDMPVMMIAINGTVPYEELYNRADIIKQQLEKLQDIGAVSLAGARTKDLYIKIDRTALEYYGISTNTVLSKLKSENLSTPLGQLKDEKSNQPVRLIGEFSSTKEIQNMLIPIPGGGSIRLSEIADVGFGYPEQDQMLRMNKESAIGIRIQKQSDANVVETVNRVKEELKKIRSNLPEGVNLVVLDDSTTFINSSLNEIKLNLIEGIITTAFVLLLFFRNWRSSFIVLVAIPTSLVSTFFMMYLFKFTLNLMSLMGLSLCVGILVDDSIVILENIQRHMHMGKSPIRAAIDGRKEIGLAAIAITLCDIVVFAPVAFMSGMTGQYFREFGLTVAFASLFSLFVSFTVTPMLASKLLKKEVHKEGDITEDKPKRHLLPESVRNKLNIFSGFFTGFLNLYKRFLIWSLDHRWKFIIVFLALFAGSILLVTQKYIKQEFTPQYDESKFSININLTTGSTLDMTNSKVTQIEDYLLTIPEITAFYANIGNDNDKSGANISVRLVSKNQRQKSQTQIINEIRGWTRRITGANISINPSSSIGGIGGRGRPISISIRGYEQEVLKQISKEVEDIVKSVQGTTDIDNTTKNTESEIRIKVDKLAANDYGVSPSDITSLVRMGIQGSTAGVYREGGKDYDIMVTFRDNQVKTPYDISSMKITTTSGKQVLINQIAEVFIGDGQKTISRMDRMDMVRVSANVQGVALGTVTDELSAKLNSLTLPFGYDIKFGGSQQQMNDSFDALIIALIIAIILVNMILVVLYESYMTPFLRLLSIPCAIIGGLGIMYVTKNTLNLMTIIGIIMLDGLSAKNGTLLIDYTNTLLRKGRPLRDALIEAGTTRLRPIIMTTMTMITGMLPAALSLGDGAEIKSGMATVVIGGMITSTLLTPIIVPIAYTLLDDIRFFFTKKHNKYMEISEVSNYEG